MPYKPKKPCRFPGCPELTDERYCAKHKTQAGRQYNQYERSPDHNKIYGYRWRNIRNRYIQKHPLCEECLKAGRLVPADEVHHIVPPEEGGTHAEENLMSLCRSCHTKTRSG
jgi:5-methylcytosine-specific restriction protein A